MEVKICIKCGKEHNGSFGSGKYCSRQCANSRNIKKENITTKVVKCIICGCNVEVKKRSSSKKTKCKEHSKQKKERKRKDNKGICLVCGNEFVKKDKEKTCSNVCRHYLMSIKASQRVLLKGTNNWKTKQELFNYKFVENIKTDSKLEQAAIIYLVDVFKADKIEKYRNILNFWENEYHKTFNPDFWVVKNNKVYIVEVKMKCSENSTHTYYTTIPYKKEALLSFCKEKGYEMIWLDFDFDGEFKKIYNKLLTGV